MEINVRTAKQLVDMCRQFADVVEATISEQPKPEVPPSWSPPVGVPIVSEYPDGVAYAPEDYYCATLHDLTGVKNDGYGHSGIDLNLAKHPFGDVDRGQPVFAVADGTVVARDYSTSYLGCVILRIEWDWKPLQVRADRWIGEKLQSEQVIIETGQPTFWRYWHLENDATLKSMIVGMAVPIGTCVGHLGNYTLGAGGDHLHFDCALDKFGPRWWFTKHPEIRWVDPLEILAHRLGKDAVDVMVWK